MSRIASRLVFNRCVYLPGSNQETVLRSILRHENVRDNQFSENFASLVARCATDLPSLISSQIILRTELMDKVRAGRFMQEVGVQIPECVELTSADVDSFIERYGLPLVLKNRVGYGGHGVTVFHHRDDLTQKIQSMVGGGDQFYIERHVAGRPVNYGAAIINGVVVQDVCYRPLKTVRPLGPAMQMITTADGEALALARRIVSNSQCSGLVNIQFLQDDEGTYLPIDFNLRTFGPATSFRKAGLNFREGYLRSLGLEARVTTSEAQVDVTIDSYPDPQRTLVRAGHPFKALRSYLTEAPENSRSLSWRYTILEALTLLTLIRGAPRKRS